jgi:hypothetical protein
MKQKYEKPTHERMLSTDFYPNQWDGERRSIKIILKYKRILEGNKFGSFYFDIEYSGFGRDYDGSARDIYDMHFIVYDDCYVQLKLDENGLFRWTDEIIELTTKLEVKSYYRAYNIHNNIVTFKAKKKTSGEAKHKFSLNFDILQDSGEWVPISLDPVIINPRPEDVNWIEDNQKWDRSLKELDIFIE